jgi:hypothetical protein
MAKWQIRLKVIPEPAPDNRVIFHHDGAVGGRNRAAPEICCGNCGTVLVTGISEISFVNVVFRCYACGAFNRLPPDVIR